MAPIKHGKAGTPLYNVWKSMRQRCNNQKNADYRWYGMLGVTVCEEWSDYKVFENWALNNGYRHGLTIDRKDENKSYGPDNCAWATILEQQKHKRNRTTLTHDGETKSLIEWAEFTGIPLHALHDRLRRKWTPERILKTPNNGPGKYERGRFLRG